MKDIGKNSSHYNFSEYYKKSPYRHGDKDGSFQGKSHSKTQKIMNNKKGMDKIKEEIASDRLPEKILAPKLGIKYLQDKIGKSKEMKMGKNGQISTKTSRSRGKRPSHQEEKEEEIVYHKIDSKMIRPSGIQYFNNQSSTLNKSKSKSKSINNLNKSANRSFENLLKKPNTETRKRMISKVHRAQIQEIIPLAFEDNNKKVCFCGSADFYISRV